MPQPLKLLIVEDNPADAGLMVLALQQAGFEPDWHRVDTEAAYLERLRGGPDVVLSDYVMPRFSGPRALELLKLSGLDVPFILVSGTIGEDTAVAAMKLGAADYLFKDRLARLGAAVTHALADSRLRRERRQKDQEFRVVHAKLQQILEHSPAVLYAMRIEGERITPYLVSENVTRLLGFTVAETLSQDWWFGQLHADDRALAAASITETLAKGASRTEYRMRHKDGSYHWVEDSRRLVRDAGGAPDSLVGVWAEISARREAERVLSRRAVELERFHRLSVGRELRMIELKREVNTLAGLAGRPSPYDLSQLESRPVTVSVPPGGAS